MLQKSSLCALFLVFTSALYCQCADVVLSTQSQVDSFHCIKVSGSLIIQDDNDNIDNIIDLRPLKDSGLTMVEGDLAVIHCTSLTALDGLNLVDTVGGDFVIQGDSSLTRLTTDSLFFSLRSIEGSLVIKNCPKLLRIAGFENLDSLGEDIIFQELNSLSDISNFENLGTIQKFKLLENSVFQNIFSFPKLSLVEDSLIVIGNPLLVECCWLLDLVVLAPEGQSLLSSNGQGCSHIDSINTLTPTFLTCPENLVVPNLPQECFGELILEVPEIVDVCGLATFDLDLFSTSNEMVEVFDLRNLDQVKFDSLYVDDWFFRLRASDFNGQVTRCSFRVQVQDVETPIFLSDLDSDTLSLMGDSCSTPYVVQYPAINDNCSDISSLLHIVNKTTADTVVSIVASPLETITLDLGPGEYEIIAIATDKGGGIALSTSSLIIADDSTPGLDDCPEDVTIALAEGCYAFHSVITPAIVGTCSDLMLKKEVISESGSILYNEVVGQAMETTDSFPLGSNLLSFRIVGAVDSAEVCTSQVSIVNNNPLEVSLFAEDLTCDGAAATISVNLDTSSYDFYWSGPHSYTSDVLNAPVFTSGTYVLTVIDSLGCETISSINVIHGGGDVPVNISKGPIDCEEGERKLGTDEDLADYDYHWTGPSGYFSSQVEPFVSYAGWYHLSAEGDYGCIARDSIFIEDDIAYSFDLLVMADTAIISVVGGTPPFTFAWDSNIGDSIVAGLENGVHTLRIIDGLGCARDIEFEILVSASDKVNIPKTLITPNPADQFLELRGFKSGAYQIFTSDGRLIKEAILGNSRKIDIASLDNGVYFLSLEEGEIHRFVKK